MLLDKSKHFHEYKEYTMILNIHRVEETGPETQTENVQKDHYQMCGLTAAETLFVLALLKNNKSLETG